MSTQFWALASEHATHAKRRLLAEGEAYDDTQQVPLPGYSGSLAAFTVTTAALALAGRREGRTLPERYELLDVALGGLATHKFSRLLSKASVTSPLRAPFTTFEDAAGSAELNENARGEGLRHTVGELITCPFCVGQWIGTCYVAGLTLAPRAARTWAALFSVTALADLLQHVYSRVRTS